MILIKIHCMKFLKINKNFKCLSTKSPSRVLPHRHGCFVLLCFNCGRVIRDLKMLMLIFSYLQNHPSEDLPLAPPCTSRQNISGGRDVGWGFGVWSFFREGLAV